jgi:hypothetical protein
MLKVTTSVIVIVTTFSAEDVKGVGVTVEVLDSRLEVADGATCDDPCTVISLEIDDIVGDAGDVLTGVEVFGPQVMVIVVTLVGWPS